MTDVRIKNWQSQLMSAPPEWKLRNWRLSNNKLECIIYAIKINWREAKQDKKEESNGEKDFERLRSDDDNEK